MQRNRDVDALQIVLGGAEDFDARAVGGDRRRRRPRGAAPAGEIVGGERAAVADELVRRAEEHDLAAALAGAGAEVEHAVRGEHHLRIVLDDDQRVAGVAQPLHHGDDAAHVARMQADRRLVEDEQGVDERGAERGRQVDALDFTPGERARLAIERQVADAHVGEKAKARADFGDEQVGRLVERGRQREVRAEFAGAVDREQDEVMDRQSRQRREMLIVDRDAVRPEALRGIEHAVGIRLACPAATAARRA